MRTCESVCFFSTGWNAKIVVLNKTTLQLYFETFIENNNSGNLITKYNWHLFNVAAFNLNQRLDTDPELGACLFHKRRRELGGSSAGARRELGGWRRPGLFWCCGRSCWWCSWRMTKRSSPAGSGRWRKGASERRIQRILKPSLGLFGLVGRRRVLLPHLRSATGHLIAPEDHHTLQHIQVHLGVDFQADFEDVALTWNHTKDHNRNRPKGRPMRWAGPPNVEPSGFAFWGC